MKVKKPAKMVEGIVIVELEEEEEEEGVQKKRRDLEMRANSGRKGTLSVFLLIFPRI